MATPDATVHVAFFRNLNLGQARSKSPTSGVLTGAFVEAGATGVLNFQTNGTVRFSAPDVAAVLPRVRARLQQATGYTDAVIVRPAPWVVELAGRLDPSLPGGEVALFDAERVPALELPWQEADSSLSIVELDALHAVTSWSDPRRGSSANPTLTRLAGVPVTCRGVPTMLRLAARLTRDQPRS